MGGIKNMNSTVQVNQVEINENYGKFEAFPIKDGMGRILANSLRRVLLSSLPGVAPYYVKIDGVLHEFSTIPGVLEDVTQIVLNLKKLKIKSFSEENKVLHLKVEGIGEVTAADIQLDSEVEIINPHLHIATLTEHKAKLNMEIGIKRGIRYIEAERHKELEGAINIIPIDSYFSPIKKVNYVVEKIEEAIEPCERITIEITTDGTIKPNEALSKSAFLLSNYLNAVVNYKIYKEEEKEEEKRDLITLLETKVEFLGLSVRALNCLKRSGIENIGQLIEKSESDLMALRNFGKKSLAEIIEKLKEKGLSLKKEPIV